MVSRMDASGASPIKGKTGGERDRGSGSGERPVNITQDDLSDLLRSFAGSSFQPKNCDNNDELVQERCIQLFQKDHPDLTLVSNVQGDLSATYPKTMIVPQPADPKGALDGNVLRDLMMKARVARCRARFPVPVILWDGKYVCRSATLSAGVESIGRSGLELIFPSSSSDTGSSSSSGHSTTTSTTCSTTSFTSNNNNPSTDQPGPLPSQSQYPTTSSTTSSTALGLMKDNGKEFFSLIRSQDIKLLKYMNVRYICDLMVEKKKVKYGMYITSSEKADKEERYSEFDILSLPYPGCEFFKTFRDNQYIGEGLVFDWGQQFVDVDLAIPPMNPMLEMEVSWSTYKSWDILTLTSQYLKQFLNILLAGDASFLIHCISGWDRTPLFVSMLRLSLWADGKVHQSLTPLEITYLTLAYDWYLFGHNLNDRIHKGEEIMFFCFYFLQHITGQEFNVEYMREAILSKSLRTSCTITGSNQSLEMMGVSVLEEPMAPPNQGTPISVHSSYLGSCTSLGSTSSLASNRSSNQDYPPSVFHVKGPHSSRADRLNPIHHSSSDESTFFCVQKPIALSIPKTLHPSSQPQPQSQQRRVTRTSGHKSLANGSEPSSYPNTPPTLTNSEEGDGFLDKDSSEDSAFASGDAASSPSSSNVQGEGTGATTSTETPIPTNNSIPGFTHPLMGDPSSPFKSSAMNIPIPVNNRHSMGSESSLGPRDERYGHKVDSVSCKKCRPGSCVKAASADGKGHSVATTFEESWQFVSETGSIKDSHRGFFSSPDSQNSSFSTRMNRGGRDPSRLSREELTSCRCSDGPTFAEDNEGDVCDGLKSSRTGEGSDRIPVDQEQEKRLQVRKEKLQAVRGIFNNQYSAVLGFQFKNGSNNRNSTATLSRFLGTVGSRFTAPQSK